jgi:hypothetical protein
MTEALQKIGDVRPNVLLMNIVGLVLALGLVFGLVAVAKLVPGYRDAGKFDLLRLGASLVLLIGLHEFIHGLAWKMVTRQPWSSFKFGFNLKAVMPYCHCRTMMSVAAYRFGALAPLLTLGPLSVIALLCYPAHWLALVAAIHLAACIGDAWIVAGLWRFKPTDLVRDHPTEAGCEVFSKAH